MNNKKYSIKILSESKIIEVDFRTYLSFDTVEEVLNQLREYIAEDYRIKIMGYINREYNYIKAFMLALSLFGKEDRIIFENKAKFSKAERRLKKERIQELRRMGYSAKQISEELGVPLKTIYRWLKEESKINY
ncbi:MAG: helix-turn-helix domain-containing protein [Candidatus Verstraetearchaeota archaeon]|nr:helix-turn-helix domain-containing protein [Candidatus Verstraetearchaeota archaeon]